MSQDRKPVRKDRFPPYGGLKAFFEVALVGNTVRAAERLGVSPSSISHQLKALEAELGVRLIENRKGKLHLLPDGIAYFEQIRQPMLDILRATDAVRSVPGRKRVSLTLTPSFAAGWLMPRLLDLEVKHPDLEVNLISTTRVVDLLRENVDLAIRRGLGPWDGYGSKLLLEETIVPVMAPALRDTVKAISLEALLQNSRVLANATVEGEWDKWCAARGLKAPEQERRYNLDTYELSIQAACDGLGLALGRRPLVDPLLEAGALVQPFETARVNDASYFVLHRDEPMSSDVRRFHDWLLAQSM